MDIIKGGTLSGTTTVSAKIASVEKDRTVFNLANHTAKAPRVVIFTRQLPGGGAKDSLKTGIKTVFGDRNVDGSVRSGNVIIETTIRTPDDQPVPLVQEALEIHYALLRDESIMDDNLEDGALPYA